MYYDEDKYETKTSAPVQESQPSDREQLKPGGKKS